MKQSYRNIIVNILVEVEEGELLNIVLDRYLYSNKNINNNKAIINNIVRGVLEYKLGIDEVIQKFIKQDINTLDIYVLAVLRAGIYEIFKIDKMKPYAVVNEYVNIIKFSKLKRLTGFINGVLRNVLRDKTVEIEQKYPLWIQDMLTKDYGKEIASKILKATSNHEISFRIINENVKENLKNKFLYRQSEIVDNCILLKNLDNIDTIEEFDSGKITVQDAGSIKVGNICKDLLSGIAQPLILDLCAAPGGKSIHISEINNSNIISCDINNKKIDKIKENAKRMNIKNIHYSINDALEFEKAFEEKFDLVLCDLPCSGLGLMLKKPDIRYRLKYQDINMLALLQKKMLNNAIHYVKKGGFLVFSTCTITKKENLDNFEYLKNNMKNIKIDDKEYLQYLQGIDDCDGFFISAFKK